LLFQYVLAAQLGTSALACPFIFENKRSATESPHFFNVLHYQNGYWRLLYDCLWIFGLDLDVELLADVGLISLTCVTVPLPITFVATTKKLIHKVAVATAHYRPVSYCIFFFFGFFVVFHSISNEQTNKL
jgi:hypothetical protein